MEALFKSFGNYIRITDFGSFNFWIYPIATFLLIWFLAIVGLKIFTKRKKLKTVFLIHKAWIISSLIISAVIIGLICYWWSINYFSDNPLQLSLLISLFISLFIPIIRLLTLRNYYTNEDLREITQQPKTPNQFEETITFSKKAFSKNKLFYILPLVGFLLLLFALNKGQNLISIVFDNSGSMERKNAIEALSETFDNLGKNNEIILTTLEGLGENSSGAKNSLDEILTITNYSRLQGGNVVSFPYPISAKNGLNQITNQCWGSPICEAIWKSFLFIKDTKVNQVFKSKLLVIITDGDDNVGNSIASSKFFFDNGTFEQYFPIEKVFIIDYSNGVMNPFLQKFQDSGCESYNVENNKQSYINALHSALNAFENNWFLIYWTIIITAIMVIIALLIEPKKIV